MLSEEHTVPVTESMLFHLDVAIAMGVAIVRRAFLYDPKGDEKFIDEAREMVGAYLRAEIPMTSE